MTTPGSFLTSQRQGNQPASPSSSSFSAFARPLLGQGSHSPSATPSRARFYYTPSQLAEADDDDDDDNGSGGAAVDAEANGPNSIPMISSFSMRKGGIGSVIGSVTGGLSGVAQPLSPTTQQDNDSSRPRTLSIHDISHQNVFDSPISKSGRSYSGGGFGSPSSTSRHLHHHNSSSSNGSSSSSSNDNSRTFSLLGSSQHRLLSDSNQHNATTYGGGSSGLLQPSSFTSPFALSSPGAAAGEVAATGAATGAAGDKVALTGGKPHSDDIAIHNSDDGFNHTVRPSWFQRLKANVFTKDGLQILILMVLTIFVSAFDWVLWKRTLNRFHSKTTDETYSFFVLQVYVLLELILSGVACLLQMHVFKVIDAEMRQFPLKNFMGIASLDTIAMLLSSLSAPVVAGHIQTLLNQANLPVTMLFSFFILSARYIYPQYIGAGLIVTGALVAAIPSVSGHDASGRETYAWGVIVYTVSFIPLSLSNIFREYVFRNRKKLDIFYMMAWVSVFQFLFGFLCIPLLAIPAFGGTSLSDIPDQITIGYNCLVGNHVTGLECHEGSAPVWFLLGYIILNFLVTILRLLLIKKASAVILQVTNAIALLTSNIMFCSEAIMGPDTESFNAYDAGGLVIVLVGFVIFRAAQIYQQRLEQRQQFASAAHDVSHVSENVSGNVSGNDSGSASDDSVKTSPPAPATASTSNIAKVNGTTTIVIADSEDDKDEAGREAAVNGNEVEQPRRRNSSSSAEQM